MAKKLTGLKPLLMLSELTNKKALVLYKAYICDTRVYNPDTDILPISGESDRYGLSIEAAVTKAIYDHHRDMPQSPLILDLLNKKYTNIRFPLIEFVLDTKTDKAIYLKDGVPTDPVYHEEQLTITASLTDKVYKMYAKTLCIVSADVTVDTKTGVIEVLSMSTAEADSIDLLDPSSDDDDLEDDVDDTDDDVSVDVDEGDDD